MGLMGNNSVLEYGFNTTTTPYEPHFHNAYELILVKAGSACIRISEKDYILNANSLVLISNLEEHSLSIPSEVYERYYLILSHHLVNEYIVEPRLLFLIKNRPHWFEHVLKVEESIHLIETSINKIIAECSQKKQLSACLISTYVTEILILAYRENISKFQHNFKPITKGILEIQKYLDEHYLEDIQIQELSKKFFINKFYLSHIFKEATGYSPKQYLMLQRLAHAKDLLIHTSMPIIDIAVQSGFSDTNNFIRSFKQHAVLTPKKYRLEKTTSDLG